MEYTLNRSSRARYVRIRVSAERGVELIVPRGVSERQAVRFLQARLDWVRRSRARFVAATHWPPRPVDLPAVGHRLEVRLEPDAQRLRECGSQLLLPAHWHRERGVTALQAWLQRSARGFLPAYCRRLAAAAGLGYRQLRIGLQSSRWGSYSSRGTLSLNAKLLLVPESLLRYVVHHELAHSLHMNHSAEFWAALQRLEPGWRALRARLRETGPNLPEWVHWRAPRGRPRRLDA